MEATNEKKNITKQRHGCVTAWLILAIITNAVTGVIYIFAGKIITDHLPENVDASSPMIILLGIIGLINIVFSVMLFQWKKLGFWGCVLTGIGTLIINLSIGIGIGQSLFGLIGIAILYGVLQIKKNNVSAWDNLD